MNIIRKFMDSGAKQEVIVILSGEFDLLRSRRSPKASLECIYNDATLSLRKSGQFIYELVICKVADDSEVSTGDGDDEYSDDSVSATSAQSKKDDEWCFKLQGLGFYKKWNEQGHLSFVWNNTLGDEEDERVQFVVSPDVSMRDVEQFLQTVYRCEYEAKFKKPGISASKQDVANIAAESEALARDQSDELAEKFQDLKVKDPREEEEAGEEHFEDAREVQLSSSRKLKKNPPSSVPKGKHLCSLEAEVLVFDPMEERFISQEKDATVVVIETGQYEYWLSVQGDPTRLGTDILPNINPTFDFVAHGFIFNYNFNQITLSFMLKFSDVQACTDFQVCISKCLWMSLNKRPWGEVPGEQKQFILNFSAAVENDLNSILEEDEREAQRRQAEEREEEEESEEEEPEHSARIISSEAFDDESSIPSRPSSEGNKSLTVAYKNDRSYVVRDNKIGVFKTDQDGMDFVAAIKNVSDLKGNRINPHDPMLYMEDRNLILKDEKDSTRLFKMDLERGKVIEEWGTGEKDVVQYGPSKKFDQLTAEQTVLGISPNGLFKIDPRLNGKNKVVQDQSKEYATKTKFSSLGTTETGYIAVGSEKGDVRLYDKLGIRAKTAIPSLGQPIRHISVSASGKWLLCTCDSSLLLMDLSVKTGKNAGTLGFVKPFPGSENVQTYILKISPEHASYIATSTKEPIKFSKAYFNTGINQEEQTIVTSSGPFAISWSLKKILKGRRKPYTMRRYGSNVIEDNFQFGTDRNVIVALKDNVSISKTKTFKAPDRQVLLPDISLFYNDDEEE
ncbi:VID27 (YNL212W) [Zygosaccharomyces parabailii]|nr:VID27 (YNL212W) [Zygosaccharomyces parabailii]CDH13422.1 related to Vacuolar import and degradation protein 27 [Zygosaccharomyces bailii ISA1307]